MLTDTVQITQPARLRHSRDVNESRNLKVVVALIASMTVGAALLLVLEARGPGWSRGTALTAQRAAPIADALITLVPADVDADPAAYDGLVWPDGTCDWQQRSAHVQIAVIADPAANLTDIQARKLLELLGSLNHSGSLALDRVRLDSACDPRIAGEMGPAADDLLSLLLRKDVGR